MTAIADPPFLVYLKDFVRAVQAKAKEMDLNGTVRYEVRSISPTKTVMIVWFLNKEDNDTDETAAKFELTLGKRYYGTNVIYVRDMDEDKAIFMEADPIAFLAYMTF